MGGYSRDLSDSIQKYIMNGVSGPNTWSPAGDTYYIGLSYQQIQADGTGIDEPIVGNYSRATSLYSIWELAVGSTSTMITNTDITFNRSDASWGAALVSVGVFDALVAGNLLWYGSLLNPKTIDNNVIAVFQAGDLTISSNPA